jgi:peptidoglycan/LPS O-acetylase OafA/YrhL
VRRGAYRLLAFVAGLRNPRRAFAALAAAACAAVAVLALLVDLSPADPFGPGLGWSPGVILIALIAAGLLVRSRGER